MPNLSINQQKEELQLHKNCSQRMLEKLQQSTVPHKLYNLSVKLKGLMQHAPSKQEQEDKED